MMGSSKTGKSRIKRYDKSLKLSIVCGIKRYDKSLKLSTVCCVKSLVEKYRNFAAVFCSSNLSKCQLDEDFSQSTVSPTINCTKTLQFISTSSCIQLYTPTCQLYTSVHEDSIFSSTLRCTKLYISPTRPLLLSVQLHTALYSTVFSLTTRCINFIFHCLVSLTNSCMQLYTSLCSLSHHQLIIVLYATVQSVPLLALYIFIIHCVVFPTVRCIQLFTSPCSLSSISFIQLHTPLCSLSYNQLYTSLYSTVQSLLQLVTYNFILHHVVSPTCQLYTSVHKDSIFSLKYACLS